GIRVGVSGQQDRLEKQEARGPDRRSAAEPGEDRLAQDRLDLEEQERAEEAGRREGCSQCHTRRPGSRSPSGVTTLSWTESLPSRRSAFTRMECQPFPRTIFWRNGSCTPLDRDAAAASTRRSSWNS